MTERAKRATRAEQQERIAAMAAMWAEGAKASVIAERMGIAEKSVMWLTYQHRDLFPKRSERGGRPARPPEVVAAIVDRVAALWVEGVHPKEIAERLSMSTKIVYELARNNPDRMPKRELKADRLQIGADIPITGNRLKDIAALWGVGLSAQQIGRRLGVTRKCVLGIVHRNRDVCVRRVATKVDALIAERLAVAAPMWAKGEPKAAIAERLGVSLTTLRELMAAAPDSFLARAADAEEVEGRRRARAELVDAVAHLWAENLPVKAIAEQLGVTEGVVIGIASLNRDRCPKRDKSETGRRFSKSIRPRAPKVKIERPAAERKPPKAKTTKVAAAVVMPFSRPQPEPEPFVEPIVGDLPTETETMVRFLDRRENQCPRPLWTGSIDAKSIATAMVCGGEKGEGAKWCPRCRTRMLSRGAAPDVSAAWAFSRRGRAA